MNKTKLEVIRINEDVIATSCGSVYAVGTISHYDGDPNYYFEGFLNGGNATDEIYFTYTKKPDVYSDSYEFYHINKEGEVIERCPCQREIEVLINHRIDYTGQ